MTPGSTPAPGSTPQNNPGQPTAGPSPRLSPWPVRIVVYAIMVLIALAAIRLIDKRAMQLQTEFEREQEQAAARLHGSSSTQPAR